MTSANRSENHSFRSWRASKMASLSSSLLCSSLIDICDIVSACCSDCIIPKVAPSLPDIPYPLLVSSCYAVTNMLEAAEYCCNVPVLEETSQVTFHETIGANVGGEQLAKRQEI